MNYCARFCLNSIINFTFADCVLINNVIEKMKHIVCIIESLGQGGAERQIASLAGLLKEAGEDVELWTYYKNDFNKHILDDYGVTYRYLEEAQNKVKRVIVLKRLLTKHNADVVISYMDSCSMALCLTKLLGAKYRLIVSERSSTRSLNIHAKLKYFLYGLADCVVPNSFAESVAIKKFAPKLESKTETIINFTDTERFLPSLDLMSNSDILHLLGVGRITNAKNLLCYVDAIKMLREEGVDVMVEWYGNTTNEGLKQELLDKIHQLKLDSYFLLHPADNQIEKIYPQFEAFCLPSIYEGFPNVICEAMSCGLPIICSDVCDNGYIVKDGVNGVLFDPGTPQNIAEGIKKYLKKMRRERLQIGRENRERIKELCSKEAFVGHYKKLIYQ